MLSTEDLLTVVALRESERAARERASDPEALADEPAEEHSSSEPHIEGDAETNRPASPELEDANRAWGCATQ